MNNSSTRLYNVLMGNPDANNAIGRTSGSIARRTGRASDENFFTKRGKSIENAFGTTGAAIVGGINESIVNNNRDSMMANQQERLNDIAKKYGYDSFNSVWDARDAAEASGDQATLDKIDNIIAPELQAQAKANTEETSKFAKDYKDYVKNDYIGQKVNQDRGKFAGSAINTLSTMSDVLLPTAGVAFNSVQGAAEGLADELEQNGFENFDIQRAGQNALVGATTGAVTGGLNKGITNSLAKRGGNLFKGGNALTRGLNNLGANTAVGRVGSTLATGAGRGAVSGAVGGATGAGLSAAMNNQDVIASAMQGAVQGAKQGAVAGGVMAGANMAISKTPGVGDVMRQVNQASEDWKNSGRTFDERLTNTLTSGDSVVGDWLMNKRQSKVLGAVGSLGNRIQDVNSGITDPELLAENDDWGNPFRITGNEIKNKLKSYGINTDGLKISKRSGGYSDAWEVSGDGTKTDLGAVEKILKNKLEWYQTDEKTGEILSGGNTFVFVNDKSPTASTTNKYVGVDTLGNRTEYTPDEFARLLQEYDNTTSPQELSGNSSSEISEVVGRAGDELLKIYKTMNGGVEANPYNRESWEQFDNWLANQRTNIRNQAPTTAKGWVKKAGQRIVEDANKRGLGLSLKDVASSDPWDRVAQEAGYNSYDEVIQRYMEANPDTPLNPNGAAGQILSWMDENPNTPTTLGEWAKRAGERIVEDTGKRGVGLGIKDVSQDMPDDIRNMNIRDYNANANGVDEASYGIASDPRVRQELVSNIEAQLADNPNARIGDTNFDADRIISEYSERLTPEQYKTFDPTQAENALVQELQRLESQKGFGVADTPAKNPQTEVFDSLTGNKTNTANKLRNAAGLKLQQQYGTIDKPTAKSTNAPETLQKIADAGFTKPADVERMADAITGSNGEVSKLVSNLVETAKPVDTFAGERSGQTLDDYIDVSIQKRGLDGINEGKAVKSQINALMKSLPSRAEGSIDFVDSPTDTFKLTQLLDSEAANYEGRSGMNYGTTTPDKLRAAQVIKDVSNLLKDRIYETVDVKRALTPEVAQNLKAYDANNKDWANYVDNEIMKAGSVKDLRSVQAPWVRAKKIIDNGYMNSMTYGGRNGGSGSSIPLTKRGLAGAVLGATVNSKPGLRLQAKALNKAADIAESRANSGTTATPTVASPADIANVIETEYNPATRVYDAIGRTEGLTNAEQARTADYLVNATQQASSPSTTNTLESLVTPNTTTGTTSVYDSMYGAPATTAVETTPTTGYFQPTGDYWTDVLASAVSSAIDNNDVVAFQSLYEMYQDALSNSSKSSGNNYSDVTKWNSGDRTKLLSAQNAMDQIDQLENAYNSAVQGTGGTSNAIQGWLRSRAADISGGNWDATASNYNNMAQSVGMGIVKNLINLGVTEADAQRYLQYLPSLTDTKEQAQQKLETLRSIYQSQINNLYAAYGA